MRVLAVRKKEKTWHDLPKPVKVKTSTGTNYSRKLYFNGYSPVFKIVMNDDSVWEFTGNHRLMVGTDWKMVKDLTVGDVFNNGLTVASVELNGIKPTMDMEVDNDHNYVLKNGVISHNSSFILGQISPSVEPLNSNYFTKVLAKGKFTYRNPYLKALLKKYDKDTADVWDIILKSGGSVKNLFFLTPEEKEVFKTFGELSQYSILKQAADRQKYIDQGQSINLMIHPDTPIKDVNALLIEAWRMGIKSLYYQRSTNPSQELARSLVACQACEA